MPTILHALRNICKFLPLPSLPDLELGSSASIAGCRVEGQGMAG